MSGYQRINFKDQNVERPKTYDVTNNPDGSITLIESFGNVEELGTPINQENMNHLEDGIDAVSFSKFSLDLTYKKDDLVTDIQDDELKIFKSLKDNNFGHLPSENDYWEEVEILGGKGSGFNLFDTKISDHILSGNEATGWAMQGTYVDGSLYPTFYDKCLEEFKNTSNTATILNNNYTVVGSPTITEDGVASGFSRNNYIECFNYLTLKDKSWTIEGSFTINESFTQNQVQLKFTGYPSQGGIIVRNDGTFSFSGTIYDNSNQNSKITISNINWEVGFIYKWVLSFDIGTGKYSLKLFKNEELINTGEYISTYTDSQLYVITSATNENTLKIGVGAAATEDSISCSIDLTQFKIYVDNQPVYTAIDYISNNPNGHKFYPIVSKSAIDEIYSESGIADYYGVDEENERIFLPRNNWFSVINSNNNVISNEDKYLYYCVGNTVVNESEINAGAVVALVESKANVSLDNAIPTNSFASVLNSAGIRTVVETYQNGTSWYRVYSDNWVEQGGLTPSVANNATSTITYLKQFSDTNYTITFAPISGIQLMSGRYSVTKTADGATFGNGYATPTNFNWFACGY